MTAVDVNPDGSRDERPKADDLHAVRRWLASFTDWFIPATLQGAPAEVHRRAVVVMWFWVAMLVWSPVYCGIYYYLNCPRTVVVIATAVVLALSIPITLRLTGSVWLAGNAFTLVVLAVLVAIIVLTGGRESPQRLWLVLIPVLSAMTSGLPSSLVWTGLALLLRIGLEILDHYGVVMRSELAPADQHVLSVFLASTLLVLIGAFAWTYDRIYQRALASIECRASALHKSEQLLANIISTIPYFVFWKNRDSNYLGCNQLFAEAAGLSHPDEIVGKSDYDLGWTENESDWYRCCDREVMESGKPLLNIEESNRRADGSPTMLLTSKVPLRDDDGKAIGILGIFTDITERKQIEQRLRLQSSALAAAGNAVVITDAQGLICWVNPAFTQLTGYSYDEAVGKNPRFLKSSEHDTSFYAQMWREITAGRRWHGEMINRRKDGTLYPEEMTITPVRGEHGEITHFVALKQDVRDRKRAEQMAGERDELRAAVKAHEHLLGVVGHELRTPLAGLMIIAEYLAREDARETAEFDEFVRRIRNEIERMSNVVNDMLEVSRLNSGFAKWNWGLVGLWQVCTDAVASIQPQVDASRVRLVVDVEPPELMMKGDEGAICRLVLNLLSNAHKHTREGSISVVSREVLADGAGYIELVVSDTGVGMTAATAARLGEAFALNAGVIGEEHVQGSGLGLSICRGIVSAHGGTIAIASRLHGGTRCVVRLRADLDGPFAPDEMVKIVTEAE